MAAASRRRRIGFVMDLSAVRGGIFLPRYYNPEISARLEDLEQTHTLVSMGDLISKGYLQVRTGDEIGKMAYATGNIPFVRTSDLSNWEIKTDPKQGVSGSIHAEYAAKQDVRAGDILFVRDGTYLIGQTALVMESDLPLLYQSHILKFRVSPSSPIAPSLLIALLNSSIVKAQTRSKQFTADIIDTLGNRYEEILLPVPRDRDIADRIATEVAELMSERSRLRDQMRKIPYWVQRNITSLDDTVPNAAIANVVEDGDTGFTIESSSIKNGVFIPRCYDPELQADLERFGRSHRLVQIGDLVNDRILSWKTGIEVGKMAYGTGNVPFIRTSDIFNWELKGEPKHAVSERIYRSNMQDIRRDDILVVRDGTYLVGTSCILTDKDTKILYCGGIYKIRVEERDLLDPYLLLALLNTPLVRWQMRTKQFTRDIIDTLGMRFFEILLPFPKSKKMSRSIAQATRNVIETRARLRNRAREIAVEVEGQNARLGSGFDDLQDRC